MRTILPSRALSLVALLALAGCYGANTVDVTGQPVPPLQPADDIVPPEEGGPTVPATEDRLAGAGGRDLTEFWATLDVPLSANVKMLAFDMMRAEVKRATGLSWTVGGVDQWEKNRAAFGGADFVTSFNTDLTPSGPKLLLWRKMAYQVCADAVARDAGKTTRVLFTAIDPAVAISSTNPAVTAQIDGLYTRFFLDAPTAHEKTQALGLLTAAYQDGLDAKEAWRALCVGYLASMKFLTY